MQGKVKMSTCSSTAVQLIIQVRMADSGEEHWVTVFNKVVDDLVCGQVEADLTEELVSSPVIITKHLKY